MPPDNYSQTISPVVVICGRGREFARLDPVRLQQSIDRPSSGRRGFFVGDFVEENHVRRQRDTPAADTALM
eukprot:2682623-Rhodomonas_salina.1